MGLTRVKRTINVWDISNVAWTEDGDRPFRDIVVIATSAGGVQALRGLFAAARRLEEKADAKVRHAVELRRWLGSLDRSTPPP